MIGSYSDDGNLLRARNVTFEFEKNLVGVTFSRGDYQCSRYINKIKRPRIDALNRNRAFFVTVDLKIWIKLA